MLGNLKHGSHLTDYTRSQADRLRAITVAGEIANLIRQIPQDIELPQITTPIGIGAATFNTCGLTLTIIQAAYILCDGSTASQSLAILKICSSIDQTVTVTADVVSDAPCLSLNIYSCDQSDGVFDAAVALLTTTAMVTGAVSASSGVYQVPINLEPYKRYVKFGKTLDATATGTDTYTITQSQLWLTGSKYKPASQNA